MKLDKPTFITLATVATWTLMGATIPGAAMGKNSGRFSPTLHSGSRLEADEQMLAADIEKLRRHLRHGASESQIALERTRIHRDWQTIVAERGAKPAELSSRLAIFRSPDGFSSPRHLKKNQV